MKFEMFCSFLIDGAYIIWNNGYFVYESISGFSIDF
jgi:hypothetical protein